MSFTRSRSPAELASMTLRQMQAALASAQQALVAVLTGNKPVMVSYAQGEGTQSVQYSRANEIALRNFIRELQAAIGQAPPRRAIGVRFW